MNKSLNVKFLFRNKKLKIIIKLYFIKMSKYETVLFICKSCPYGPTEMSPTVRLKLAPFSLWVLKLPVPEAIAI